MQFLKIIGSAVGGLLLCFGAAHLTLALAFLMFEWFAILGGDGTKHLWALILMLTGLYALLMISKNER